jgi:hypothetical protein
MEGTNPLAATFTMNLAKAQAHAMKVLQQTKDRMVWVFNKTRKPSPEYKSGEKVWVEAKRLPTN